MMICKNCIHYDLCEYSTIVDKEVDCKDFISKTIKADIVHKMQSKLTDASEFALRADSNGGMYYVDCAAWVEEVAKELLEENK